MALNPKRRIFYMKYSSHLPINYGRPFKMITFIVMRCFYYQYEINIQRTKLSCGYRNAYLHCGYFYLMAMIRILPASDEPPISEPHVSLISRQPIIVSELA